jgi:Asp-tRNA(Asn)/Glu-tRNA(Gln) amidotransferase A subunit family amidase
MAVLGLGTETAGSIQNPASAQGLVGIKPTFGLVPTAGVVPLSGSGRDVVGPIGRCVRDAALCLDALAGYSCEDPKTILSVGRRPRAGYSGKLRADALAGRRIGLYGAGWREQPLSAETHELYERAQSEIKALKATLVADPFATSGFAKLAKITPGTFVDGRGWESIPYDIHSYVSHLGAGAALRSFADFARATAADDIFGPKGRMRFAHNLPGFEACLADPTRAPDLADFFALREAYLGAFDQVFQREGLDALIFPQMREEIPALRDERVIQETTVSEIDIAGLPAVVVPAGYYKSGAPFCLIVVGRLWSEEDLLAYAFAYEQGTKHRRAPALKKV